MNTSRVAAIRGRRVRRGSSERVRAKLFAEILILCYSFLFAAPDDPTRARWCWKEKVRDALHNLGRESKRGKIFLFGFAVTH
jgi:hypothetical protein